MSRASNVSALSRTSGKPASRAPSSEIQSALDRGVSSMLRTGTEMGNVGIGAQFDDLSGINNMQRPMRSRATSRMSTASSMSNTSSRASKQLRHFPWKGQERQGLASLAFDDAYHTATQVRPRKQQVSYQSAPSAGISIFELIQLPDIIWEWAQTAWSIPEISLTCLGRRRSTTTPRITSVRRPTSFLCCPTTEPWQSSTCILQPSAAACWAETRISWLQQPAQSGTYKGREPVFPIYHES